MAIIKDIKKSFIEALNKMSREAKATIEKCPPNRLYRVKKTEQLGIISLYLDDGTFRMVFDGTYKAIKISPFEVFGLTPEDVEEADIPSGGKLTGIMCKVQSFRYTKEYARLISERRIEKGH